MILITGHLGFVGKHLTHALDNIGVKWVGYDLLRGNDIRDKHNLDCIFEKEQIDTVIHLAARAGVRRSKDYPEEYISTNILGTNNLLELSEKYGIKKFIFYSSSSVYGQVKKLPVNEKTDKCPKSLYGITKLTGEYIVNNSSVPSVIIRPFTVYGENGRKDAVIFKWIEQYNQGKPLTVFGDGNSCRGYVYVKDLIQATIKLATGDNFPWQHNDFNLGGSEVIYLKDIINEFKAVCPNVKIENLPQPKEDIYQQYTDTTKAKQYLMFEPQPKFLDNLNKILCEEIKLSD